MKEPVDHILRPRLPWRRDEAAITECGFDASAVKALSRDEYFARRKDLGSQRAAMITCMTCSSTAERHGTWDDDPRHALEREIQWEHRSRYGSREDRGDRLKDELLAIAALIEAHLDEFHATVAQTGQRREWLAKKAELAKKPPPRREPGGL